MRAHFIRVRRASGAPGSKWGRPERLAVAAGLTLFAAACGPSAPSDTGVGALMHVPHAQFYPGKMPAAEDGPPVQAVNLSRNTVIAATTDSALSGALGPAATAAAIGLAGDSGYWIVTAGPADVEQPGFPTFSVLLGFSSLLPPGNDQLVVRAVDAAGRFGPPNVQAITAQGPPLPDGTLVVSLRWDTESDLDLHLIDPDGTEIWYGSINSYQPPTHGLPPDPNAWADGGILDFDSNAQCVIDGRRLEDVVWKAPPPSGRYVVKVDAFSLCGQSFANWTADVRLNGSLVAHAAGEMFEPDTEVPHGLGAGLLALQFDVP